MQVPPEMANGKPSVASAGTKAHLLDPLQKSGLRLRSLLAATSHVAWTATEDGCIEELSDTWSTLTGQTNEEMSGWGWARVLHPSDHDYVLETWKDHLHGQTSCEVECRIRGRNGQYRWMAIRAIPVFGEEGHFVEWIGTCTDIEGRKRTEAALRKSEVSHRAIVDTAHEGVWLLDADANTTFVNARMAVLLAYEPGEMVGRSLFEFVLEEELAAVKAKFDLRRQGVSESYDVRLRRSDGTTLWAMVTASPYYDESGAFAGALGMVTDITERKKAESEIVQSQLRYERLVNHLDGIIWEGTANLSTGEVAFTLVSERLRKILGYDPQAWVDDPSLWLRAIHEDDRSWAPAACMASTRDGHDHTIEYRMIAADGRIVWLRDLVRVVETHGDVVTSAGVMFDVTEQKEAEKALVEAKERAEELARLKSAFLANMSHEIRTPLTSILGFAEILEVEPADDVRSMAKHIMNAGQRLMLTLDSVMDLAQLESGSLRLYLVELDAVTQLKELLPMFERQAKQQGLYLKLECERSSMKVFADTGALLRVLTNLLSNALKFTTEGGVTVRLEEENGFVRIDVVDTGIGISKPFLTKLFEDFKQESEGFSRNYEGVGLGLSITKRLVDLMGGSIAVTSRKGSGSTFTIRLPVRAPNVPIAISDARVESSAPRRRGSILVVEDQDDAQHLMCHLLRPVYDVDIAVTAEEAIGAAERRSYNLILMDINLGGDGPNGTEVFKHIRRRSPLANIPVIACTAYALPGDEERFIAEGFDGYLGKPFRKADLFNLIESLISRGSE